MKNISFLLILFCSTYITNAQNKYILENYNPKINTVLKSQSVVYYGIDFSKTILSNPKKIGKDAGQKKYFPAWIRFINNEIPAHKKIRKWLKIEKYNFECVGQPMFDRIDLIPEKCVSMSDYSFDINTVKNMVKTYKLNKKSGIGFVVIVENLNKEGKYVTAYCTFFDISNKEVLWSVKTKGSIGGGGMTSRWGDGIIKTIKNFMKKSYKKQKKNYLKYIPPTTNSVINEPKEDITPEKIEIKADKPIEEYYKTKSSLNMRKGAGTNYAVILTIPSNTRVKLIDKSNVVWYKIEYNGDIGYVSAKYIIKIEN